MINDKTQAWEWTLNEPSRRTVFVPLNPTIKYTFFNPENNQEMSCRLFENKIKSA